MDSVIKTMEYLKYNEKDLLSFIDLTKGLQNDKLQEFLQLIDQFQTDDETISQVISQMKAVKEQGSKSLNEKIMQNFLSALILNDDSFDQYLSVAYLNEEEEKAMLEHKEKGIFLAKSSVSVTLDQLKTYFQTLEEYDVTQWTVDEAKENYVNGVTKKGQPIKVFVRPYDSKKLIFCQREEINQILNDDATECWVIDNEKFVNVTFDAIMKKEINYEFMSK